MAKKNCECSISVLLNIKNVRNLGKVFQLTWYSNLILKICTFLLSTLLLYGKGAEVGDAKKIVIENWVAKTKRFRYANLIDAFKAHIFVGTDKRKKFCRSPKN